MSNHFNSLRDDFNPSPVSEFTQFSDNASNSSFIGSNSRYNQFYRRYEDTLQKSELKIHELEDKESELENTYIALIDTLDDMRENRLEEMSFNEKLLRLESQQMNDLAEKKELSSLNSQSMKEMVLKNMEQKLNDLNEVYNDQKARTDNALTQLNGLKTLYNKLSNIHGTLESINPNDALRLLNEKLTELNNQKKAYEDRISYLEDQIENAKVQKMNALHSPSMLSLADEIRDSSFCAMAPPLSHRNAKNTANSINNPDESADKSAQFLQENSIFKQHFNYSPGLLLRQRSNSSSFHSTKRFLSSIDIQSDSSNSDLMKKYKELEKQLEISEKNEIHMINTIKRLREKGSTTHSDELLDYEADNIKSVYYGNDVKIISKVFHTELDSFQLQAETRLKLQQDIQPDAGMSYILLFKNYMLLPTLTSTGILIGLVIFHMLNIFYPEFKSSLVDCFL